MPLPPPIIPETEDSTPSPVSETSSGYISTSISTTTLADVYTLSWDLPAPSSGRADGFEAVPDEEEEDNKATYLESLQVDRPQSPVSSLLGDANAATEKNSTLSKPESTDSNLSPSVQKTENEEPDSEEPCPTKLEEAAAAPHTESEQLDDLEPLEDSATVPEEETHRIEGSPEDPPKSKPAQKEEPENTTTDKTEPSLSFQIQP